MTGAGRLLVPAALLGLLGLLAVGLTTPRKDPPNVLIGRAAPTFALKDLGTRGHDLAALRGRPVVVNFWASWCGPCRQEAPLFKQLSDAPGNVAYLGILYNDQPAGAEKFNAEYGLTYPTLLDPGSKAAMKYGIGQVPVTYVIDTGGNVVYSKLGPVTDEAEFRAALKTAGAQL